MTIPGQATLPGYEKPPRVLKKPRKAVLYAHIAALAEENIQLRKRIAWLELPWYVRAWGHLRLFGKAVYNPPFVRDGVPDAHPGD